jgi:hypothetical protein
VASSPSFAEIENSILLEPQAAGLAGSSVACTASDVPNQVETAPGTVTCPSTAGNPRGNSFSTPAQLFQAFPSDLHLRSGSPAIETGSTSPLGTRESTTDRDGRPRILDSNSDCHARRDKGAYETPGPVVTCPTAPGAKPGVRTTVVDPAPVITRVRLSRKRFRSAGRRRRGTRIGYTLSETAGVRFTVERRVIGRRVENRCRRRTARNQRRRRCVRWVGRGSFLQKGKGGRNRRSFRGRLRDRRLPVGRYRFSLRARDLAGKSSSRRRIGFRVIR